MKGSIETWLIIATLLCVVVLSVALVVTGVYVLVGRWLRYWRSGHMGRRFRGWSYGFRGRRFMGSRYRGRHYRGRR